MDFIRRFAPTESIGNLAIELIVKRMMNQAVKSARRGEKHRITNGRWPPGACPKS